MHMQVPIHSHSSLLYFSVANVNVVTVGNSFVIEIEGPNFLDWRPSFLERSHSAGA